MADLGLVSRNGRDDSGKKYLKTIKYLLYLSTDGKINPWDREDPDGKIFYCQWVPLESFPDQIQFFQEKHLSETALSFLKLLHLS